MTWRYYVRDSVFTSEVSAVYRVSDEYAYEQGGPTRWRPCDRATVDQIRRDIYLGGMDLTGVPERTARSLASRLVRGPKPVIAPWGDGKMYGGGMIGRRSPLLPPA